jgi:indolepyruvate ferredoxin oxidoreductase
VKPIFRLLAKCRKIRGSRWDLFGFNQERRRERKLIQMYEQDIETILQNIRIENYTIAIELSRWPERVRGFGPIKQANIIEAETLRENFNQLLRGGQNPQPVIFNSEPV